MKYEREDLLDRLLMSMTASKAARRGRYTQADSFMADVARGPGGNAEEVVAYCARQVHSVYRPPKAADRVVLFADGSGAYVHADGLATPMGPDIRGEVSAWTLLEGSGP